MFNVYQDDDGVWRSKATGQPCAVTNTPRPGEAPGSRDRTSTMPDLSTTQAILNERQKTHGDYSENARISQNIKAMMHDPAGDTGWEQLPSYAKESLEMIALKISRILSGRWDTADHWRDIAGYATLVAERCSK